MPSLRELQQSIQAYVLARKPGAQAEVLGSPSVSAETRLEIYANAYRVRLQEALATDFPALRTMVGPVRFACLAAAYTDAHPSGHFSIRYFGQHLHAFLASFEDFRNEPWLSELAAFEWRLGEAFDAAHAPPLTAESLAGLAPAAWPNIRLAPHPSVRRLDFAWNVTEIWQAIDRDETPGTPLAYPQPLGWLVWRQELKTFFRSLEREEAWALDAVLNGTRFSDLCEGLCRWLPEHEVAQRAARFLRRWINDGLVTAIDGGSG
ncbi:MAG: DNA-binding domain-containing protein [Gammaproteobacteria bacterium]